MKRKVEDSQDIETPFHNDDSLLILMNCFDINDLLDISLLNKKIRLFSLTEIKNRIPKMKMKYNIINQIEKSILDCFTNQTLSILYQRYFILNYKQNTNESFISYKTTFNVIK